MQRYPHAQLAAFHNLLHGQASRQDAKAVVRHLLAGCGRCLKRAATTLQEDKDQSAWNYDAVFARFEETLRQPAEVGGEERLLQPAVAA